LDQLKALLVSLKQANEVSKHCVPVIDQASSAIRWQGISLDLFVNVFIDQGCISSQKHVKERKNKTIIP